MVQPATSPNFGTLNISTGYPGTNVLVPANPIMPDGTVNIMIVIRGGGGAEWANKSSLNAVIVTAEAGGMASLENTQAYGRAAFPNAVISKICQALTEKTGKPIKLGKFGLSSFSGGYDAVNKILMHRGELFYTLNGQKIKYDIDSVYMMDGMHHSIKDNPDGSANPEMAAYIQYAKEAMKDPSKKFLIMHSAIKPPYASTTETSDYILKHLGLNRKISDGKQVFTKGSESIAPKTVAGAGGFNVYQMYDQPDKASGNQHVFIGGVMPQVWQKDLAKQWNQGTVEVPDQPSNVSTDVSKTNKGRTQLLERVTNFLDKIEKAT